MNGGSYIRITVVGLDTEYITTIVTDSYNI